MAQEKIKAFYQEKIDALSTEIKSLKIKSRLLYACNLVCMALFIALLIIYVKSGHGFWWVLALIAVFFLSCVPSNRRRKFLERLGHASPQRDVYKRELCSQDGDASGYSALEVDANADQTLKWNVNTTEDGAQIKRFDRTVTTGGHDELARAFNQKSESDLLYAGEERAAIDELVKAEDFRADFLAQGLKGRVDTDKIKQALEKAKAAKISLPNLKFLSYFPLCSGIIFVVLICWAIFGSLSWYVPVAWGCMQAVVTTLCCAKPLREIRQLVGDVLPQLAVYTELTQLLEAPVWKEPGNWKPVKVLKVKRNKASSSFSSINFAAVFTDGRYNIFLRIICNFIYLLDFWGVRSFAKWQSRDLSALDEWMSVVSKFDARVSVATDEFNKQIAAGPIPQSDPSVASSI